MKVIFSMMTLFGLIMIGCASNKSLVSEKTHTGISVAPGECRVTAEIIKVDSTLVGGPASDPCSKAPCLAWIKINKVIGYGAGSSTINSGDTLKAKFAFTLAPAGRENFPTLKESLPGLKLGSLFETDVQLMPSYPALKEKEKLYLIYGYQKLN